MCRIEKLKPPAPKGGSGEIFEKIFSGFGNFRCERIISRGEPSPEGFWYDQEDDEFALLESGKATIVFEGEEKEMEAGDFIIIGRHARHRVEKVSDDAVWLAFFGKFKSSK